MTMEDRILYEIYFGYQGLSNEEGDYYIDIIRHTKEVTDSEVNVDPLDSTAYDLVMMNLTKLETGEVSFNGAISNGNENKCLEGVIKKIGDRVFVTSKLVSLHPSIPEKKPYDVIDYFTFKGKNVLRKTSYSDGKYFETIMEPFKKEEIDAFVQSKADHMKQPGMVR